MKAWFDANDAAAKADARAKERIKFLDARKVGELESKEGARHLAATERLASRRGTLQAQLDAAPNEADARAALETANTEASAWEAQLEALRRLARREDVAIGESERATERHRTTARGDLRPTTRGARARGVARGEPPQRC